MTTAERMKLRRKELGLSAEYVAAQLGCSPATIYRYEKGDIEKMPMDILSPLSSILCTTPSYLMGWADESSSNIEKSTFPKFTPQEQNLLILFRRVNSAGQNYIMKQADFASQQKEYQKSSPAASGE